MEIKDIVFVYHLREANLLDWHSRVHSHASRQYELHYFVSGNGRFCIGDQVHEIQRGQLFLTFPDQVHSIQPGELSDPLTYYAVLFEIDQDHDAPQIDLQDPELLQRFPVSLGPSSRLRFEDMKNRYNAANAFHRLSARYELLAFLFDLFGRLQDEETVTTRTDDGSGIYVEQAMDLFQKNVFGNIRLAEVASKIKISKEYLIKLFQRRTGITPMRFYQNAKMEAAVSLLLNTTLSIKEISFKLGFSSQYHFSRNFKLYSGSSPTEYRTRYFLDNPTGYHTKIIAA